ncbi:MAG: hypothetical protein ACKO13_08590 [Cytophagales bacterium]
MSTANLGHPLAQGDIKAALAGRLFFTIERLQTEVEEKQGDAAAIMRYAFEFIKL